MPLIVDIRINNKHISTLHIGRESGGFQPDDMNVYRVVRKEQRYQEGYISLDEWNSNPAFEHRYGDGAEVCVMKAIEALRADGQLDIPEEEE